MKKQEKALLPVVKWAGGKRQLLGSIVPLIPKSFSSYAEPFLGGGAVLFNIMPEKAVINDVNFEVANIYRIIKDSPSELISLLKKHKKFNSEEYFYKIRALDRNEEEYSKMSNIEKAARTIYLNRTCYNGLFRVNKKGQFNNSYEKYKNPDIASEERISAMSKYFNRNNIKIANKDYKEILKNLGKETFVYLDPPYMPVSSSSFTKYTKNGFGVKEHMELKKECDKLNSRGIKFLMSNSENNLIRELYKNYEIITVTAKRSISSKSERRGKVNEVLIKNYS